MFLIVLACTSIAYAGIGQVLSLEEGYHVSASQTLDQVHDGVFTRIHEDPGRNISES